MTKDRPAETLHVRDVKKQFGGVHALAGVSFDVAPGEVVALVGPNGAGKTTCYKLICGEDDADGGSIRLGHAELVGLQSYEVARLGIARTFQVAEVFQSATVRENIAFAMACQAPVLRWFGSSHAAHVDPATIERALEESRLSSMTDVVAGTLAYGDMKRLDLALALATVPRLLLMDEPLAGVGVEERHPMLAMVRDIARTRSIPVLLTEHDLPAVRAYADKIVVLCEGKIQAVGSPSEVFHDVHVTTLLETPHVAGDVAWH